MLSDLLGEEVDATSEGLLGNFHVCHIGLITAAWETNRAGGPTKRASAT